MPICLLYLRTDNQLVPIAIQLEQGSHNNIATWTPKDEPLDWLLAKMWFRHADLQVHQIRSRYALTNVIGEIFAVAMYRCLPTVHPIYKLLKTYLGSSIPVNVLSRKNLISRVRIRSSFEYVAFLLRYILTLWELPSELVECLNTISSSHSLSL